MQVAAYASTGRSRGSIVGFGMRRWPESSGTRSGGVHGRVRGSVDGRMRVDGQKGKAAEWELGGAGDQVKAPLVACCVSNPTP